MQIEIYYLLFIFFLGAIVGSFLNVVALRFNTGIGLGGRSGCMSCGKKLTWSELVPIFSFLFQRGSCLGCKSKISWQYPLVEFIAGIIFVLLIIKFPPISYETAIFTFIQIIIACLLLIIAIYDIKHKIIPDSFVYTFSVLALISIFIDSNGTWLHIPTYTQLLAGPMLAAPFAILWFVSKGAWIGLGDAKLALGIGWLLGINGGVNAVVLSFWIGAIISIIWLFYTYRKIKSRFEIPFGPYLILGLYIVLLFDLIVIDLRILSSILSM